MAAAQLVDGTAPKYEKGIQQDHAQPEQPHDAEQPQHTAAVAFGRDKRDGRDNGIGDAAEEAPDVVGESGSTRQAQHHPPEQRVHQHRQKKFGHVVVPEGQKAKVSPRQGLSARVVRLAGARWQRARPPDNRRCRPSRKKAGSRRTPPRVQTGNSDQVFSCRTVCPRGLRISSMNACISADGALVNRLTTQITRNPSGMPNNPQLMLLRLNQPTLLASGWASGRPVLHGIG